MCVVTRERHRAVDLVHLVAMEDGSIAVDRAGKLDGRGAWVRADRDTLLALEKRSSPLARALKAEVRTDGLLDRVRAANLAQVLDLLSLASRAGRLASGSDQAETAAKAGEIVAFIVASDASPKSVEAATAARGLPVYPLPLDREALGLRIGKGPRAVVGLRPGGPTSSLVEQLRRMALLR